MTIYDADEFDSPQEAIAHYRKLLAASRARKRTLEVQLAEYGIAAPAHVRTEFDKVSSEIQQLQEHIKRVETVLNPPSALNSQSPDSLVQSAAALDRLPILLDPTQPATFKDQLLIHRKAEITIIYSNGRVERKEWNVSRFTRDSNVMGNLRSRPEFRSGEWQARGIVEVHVKVLKHA